MAGIEKTLRLIDKKRKEFRKVEDEHTKALKHHLRAGADTEGLQRFQALEFKKKEMKSELDKLENDPKIKRLVKIRDSARLILTNKELHNGKNIKVSHFKDLHNIKTIPEKRLLELAKKYSWLVDVKNRELKVDKVKTLLQIYHGKV